MGNESINVKAPAKVNLFLEVFGKRYDGYHEIETVMQEIDLVDDIVIEEKEKGIEITCTNPRIPPGKDNIVWKATELMQKETGINKGVSIHLFKRIPISAGLGGGSSDAAATLKGLNKLWKVGLNENELMRLASMLGSDVPFFIKGNTAICRGRGEIVTPVPISTYFSYVLLYPDIEISTASIYQNLKIDLTKAVKDVRFLLEILKNGNAESVGKLLYNRLEEVALRLYPDLHRIKEALRVYNFCGLLLSGSGSAIYGLCRRQSDAEEIKNQLDKCGLGQVFLVTNAAPNFSA
ncbi:MAG TPA: 4-(cytidine 5'-diphospho)-2-C-methyl-D-erythritol kinase [Candidatus Brocadiia bacterium]|nr:4-(cytidine 5'-diphospho)-2-C-methyl-D-erythritol kinase [Planctomycetota bacterium]MDO8092755.1 4-(cytidine 5'-diphospho)-2-C-methyl-D-erythritol kinase [Candidatus Brocadiales bacterium]